MEEWLNPQNWLTFDKLITPSIIKIIFWVLAALIVLSGLVRLLAFGDGFGGVIRSLLWIVLGPIFVRVYCEIILVLFRINDRLGQISDNTKKA